MLPPSLHSITREAEKSMLTVTNILHCVRPFVYREILGICSGT